MTRQVVDDKPTAYDDSRNGRNDSEDLDGSLRVHDTRGVHVADGAAVPGPLGVNPQITIMALATRLAHHLLATDAPACRS